jgi:hypothetical protein
MACAVSIFTATPRAVTCREIGTVAKIAAANSRPMIDPAFMTVFLLGGALMASSRLYKIAHPGHDDGYSGGLDVHCSLMDAALNEKPPQINIPK